VTSADARIAVHRVDGYSRGRLAAPYRPGSSYPELPLVTPASASNRTYEAVRELLRLYAGAVDGARFCPLAGLVEPGMRVVIKPNLVALRSSEDEDTRWATITDAAVLRPIADYVACALQRDGTITVADSPLRATDFAGLARWTGLEAMLDDVSRTWGVSVELVDLRDEVVADAATFDRTLQTRRQGGDPRGVLEVDLGADSLLEELGGGIARLRSTAAVGANDTAASHRPGHHLYALARSVTDADFIVNVPKLKTHKKAGITCGLKNYVGAVVRKEWLPHHRRGSPALGGDEHADDASWRLKLRERLKDAHRQTRSGRLLLTPAKWLYRQWLQDRPGDPLDVPDEGPMANGGWSGNDTCWRMVLDIVRALLYARVDGSLARERVRRQLTIVDGLLAGEGDGPLRPTPRRAGLLLAGTDVAWVDYCATLLMGFRPHLIPQIDRATRLGGDRPLTSLRRADLDVRSTNASVLAQLARDQPAGDPFMPPLGWARHLAGDDVFALALRTQAASSLDY
jgi:uncharacterized protein (DUF362 family)